MNVALACGSYTPPATGRRSLRAATPVAGVLTRVGGKSAAPLDPARSGETTADEPAEPGAPAPVGPLPANAGAALAAIVATVATASVSDATDRRLRRPSVS